MDKGACFYMGVGKKDFFYTLNYTCLQPYSVSNEFGVSVSYVPMHFFQQNLSHDFAQAVAKLEKMKADGLLGDTPVKYLSHPHEMSELEKQKLEIQSEKIRNGIIQGGPHLGKHVSELSQRQIQVILLNEYSDLGNTTLIAHQCYAYAEAQGWIADWTALANKKFDNPEFISRINAVVQGEQFLVGKFKGKSISDILYTKKGTPKKAVQSYLEWWSKVETILDYIDMRFGEPISEGCACRIYDNFQLMHFGYTSVDVVNKLTDDLLLTAIMVRNYLIKMGNMCSDNKTPLYGFAWKPMVFPLKEVCRICLHHDDI